MMIPLFLYPLPLPSLTCSLPPAPFPCSLPHHLFTLFPLLVICPTSPSFLQVPPEFIIYLPFSLLLCYLYSFPLSSFLFTCYLSHFLFLRLMLFLLTLPFTSPSSPPSYIACTLSPVLSSLVTPFYFPLP